MATSNRASNRSVSPSVQRTSSNRSNRSQVSVISDRFGGAVSQAERVNRAKQKAENKGNAFFTAEEALQEVAKVDGVWNWALIGPDPDKMPLSGGGPGGVEEMRDNLGKHAHSFGLLRMTFAAAESAVIKWVFINGSTEDEGTFSAMQRGRANLMEPKMKQKVAEVVSVSVTVQIKSKAQCTPEFLLENLRKVSTGYDVDMVNLENYTKFMEAQEQEAEREKVAQEKAQTEKIMAEVAPPITQAIEPEPEELPSNRSLAAPPEEGMSRQRRKLKIYSRGEQVEIYSASQGHWMIDAEIVDVLKESMQVNGFTVRAGSMKVVYDNGRRYKWISPNQMGQMLRPSPRPRPPDAKFGKLQIETHSWFSTSWTDLYVELNKGFMQWWQTETDAKEGKPPTDSIYMQGTQMQHWTDDDEFKLRTDTTQGAIHVFKGGMSEETSAWVEALWLHAAFCNEAREFYEAKMGGSQMRSQLLTVMAQKHKMRGTIAAKGANPVSVEVEVEG